MDNNKFKQLITLAKSKNFSGHMLIIDEDQTFEFCQGYEDLEKENLITAESIFPIASGTKFLTALAIGQLIDQKKITLDTYVKDVLDLNIKSYAPDIKIKHLLSHTSGIPDYLDERINDLSKINNLKLCKVNDYIKLFPHGDMEFKPGSKFTYNDGGFVYLALIIEEVSKMSYQEYINHHLLKPLMIDRSGIFSTSSQHPHKVMGFINQDRTLTHIGHIPEMSGGDGGAYMNAYDFHQMIQAFLKGQIISHSLVELFTTPQIHVNEEENLYYGYGLWLKKCGQTYIPHVIGVDSGVRFKSMFTNQTFYYVVSNTNDDIWDIMNEIENIAC